MRALPRLVMSGAMGVAVMGMWAPAAHAEGPLEVNRWDTSTCETEGAASPVITYTSGESLPMSVVHAFGIGDQDGYASVRVGPGAGAVTETWAPVREGEHVVYEQNREPGGPRGLELTITAPACAAGSPSPSETVWPKIAVEEPPSDISATWGEPSCGSAVGATPPVLPFTWENEGGAGTLGIERDGVLLGRTNISPDSSGSHDIGMTEGEHTYVLVDEDDDALDTTTVIAPGCTDEPGTDEPTTGAPTPDQPTTDQPTTDQPTAGQPGADDAGSDDAGADTGTTPVIPAVVQTDSLQTDSLQADHSPLTPAALALFVALLAAGAVRAVRGSGD